MRWRGRERVVFTNAGTGTLRAVWLRLWANGVSGCSWPALRLRSVRGATPGPAQLGCTAVRLRLAEPLEPGERGSVTVGFGLKVPAARARFGVSNGVRLFSNALPIFALKADEGWHLDRFTPFGEAFVSELADWKVRMRLPAGLDVAGPGRQHVRRRGGGPTRVAFSAPGAREFARAAGRLRTFTARVGGVTVRVAAARTTPRRRQRATVREVRRALPRLTELLGPYGRPELVVVLVRASRWSTRV